MSAAHCVGLDFGTSNSAIAVASSGSDQVRLGQFPTRGGLTEAFRSVLYYHLDRRGPGGELVPLAGPAGIEHYLETDDGQGRLIQSMTGCAALRSFAARAASSSTRASAGSFCTDQLA